MSVSIEAGASKNWNEWNLNVEKQLLHLVFGGELETPEETQFRDLSKLDIVGIYPNYAEAQKVWQAKAQETVDNAHMRYFIVHLHRLLDPDGVAKT